MQELLERVRSLFALRSSVLQRGLMTEAVEVVTDFWFNVLKCDVLRRDVFRLRCG
jgi:hypothetical protein